MRKVVMLLLIAFAITLSACSNDDEVVDVVIDNEYIDETEAEDNQTQEEIVATLDGLLEEITIDFDSFEYDDTDYVILESTNEVIEITESGYYVLEGEYSKIIINTPLEDVDLILNGANITSTDGPAILVLDGDDITISVNEDTVNTISDTEFYLTTVEDLELNSAIWSTVDLEINGTGTLYVYGNYNNAIYTKDDLKISEVNLYVESVDDGIIGRDYVAIKDTTIEVVCDGDGIKTTNDELSDKGFIYIESGDITINAFEDGIQSINFIIVYDGTFTIDALDNGIQSNTFMYLGNGSYTITAGADGLNAVTELQINSGEYVIDADDDGIHSDEILVIDGGSILVESSYEAIEAFDITINGGSIAVNSYDDGINGTAGGGQEHGTTYQSTGGTLTINGGVIQVNATTGDGVDVNGYIYMTGGFLLIYGTSEDNQAAVDYDMTFEISGGTLITLGSTGMIQAPSVSSEQASILYADTEVLNQGDLVTLYDESGEILIQVSGIRSFTGVVISTEDLVLNDSYTLEVGSTTYELELNSVVTELGDGGTTMSGPGGGLPPRR